MIANTLDQLNENYKIWEQELLKGLNNSQDQMKDVYVRKSVNIVLEQIKSEINNIDSMTFVGSGSGCASEMQMECLKVINKYMQEVADE